MLLCLLKADLLMNVVNGFGAPFTENPSFHHLTHLLLCVKYFGQLRLMDCFPLGGAFSYLRQFFVATSNSTVTSFKNEMEMKTEIHCVIEVKILLLTQWNATLRNWFHPSTNELYAESTQKTIWITHRNQRITGITRKCDP